MSPVVKPPLSVLRILAMLRIRAPAPVSFPEMRRFSPCLRSCNPCPIVGRSWLLHGRRDSVSLRTASYPCRPESCRSPHSLRASAGSLGSGSIFRTVGLVLLPTRRNHEHASTRSPSPTDLGQRRQELQASLRTTPSGSTPYSQNLHRSISSRRATPTMPIRLNRLLPLPYFRANHPASALRG